MTRIVLCALVLVSYTGGDTIKLKNDPIAVVDITVKPCISCDSTTAIALTVYDAEDLKKSLHEWRRKRKAEKNPCSSPKLDFEVKAVDDQWLVIFDGYYSKVHRHEAIKKALGGEFFEIVPRDNPAACFDSDFEVVRWSASDKKNFIDILEEHEDIKEVKQQKQLFRTLQYVKTTGDEESKLLPSEARVRRPGYRKTQSVSSSDYWFGTERFRSRKLMRSVIKPVTNELQADMLWEMGFTGKGIRVAVFDTGLPKNHPHFRNVKDRTNWTNEKTLDDGLGHGTFVAGVIASSAECMGFAPDADLHIYRVFTNQQVSYTSWFLDAFNYAILKKIQVLNLSIGGPDFMDTPFVDKVWEMSANGIIMVSAIGNDGPLYGTLNNPADQMDVIGVGGTDFAHNIARFSSRGMTTWELPTGYGRVKPDVVTYGSSVRGSGLHSGCRSLSGTSVASPVVAGVVTLLYSTVPEDKRHLINPASMKQALMHGAVRIDQTNMFEQGAGRVDLIQSWRVLNSYIPQASLSPPYIDFTECPYMWPYCSQPLYHTAMPAVVNVTILNGLGISGRIRSTPVWRPYYSETWQLLDISVTHSRLLWPWTGFLAVTISVNEFGKDFEGVVSGHLEFTVESTSPSTGGEGQDEVMSWDLKLPIRVTVIPTPKRWRRLLWDQYHNLRYPPGYFPRDDLKMKNDPLDWNGDHIHTNFRDLYLRLRAAGYFVEILGTPLNCFDAANYGTLLIVDTEEEFFEEEIEKLEKDVSDGLNLIVFADWFNTAVMEKVRFFDENTRQWWVPDTGGSNIPALNELLEFSGIQFGNVVSEGDFKLAGKEMYFASGTSIIGFPDDGKVIMKSLKDQGAEIIKDQNDARDDSKKTNPVAILGLTEHQAGKIGVYGDSNCLDGAHLQKDCYWLLEELLQYFRTNMLAPEIDNLELWSDVKGKVENYATKPERLVGNHLHRSSKVLEHGINLRKKPLPVCPNIVWLTPKVANETKSNFQWKNRPLLSVDLEDDANDIQRFVSLPADPTSLPMWVACFVFACCVAAVAFLLLQFQKPRKERRKTAKLPKTGTRKNLNT